MQGAIREWGKLSLDKCNDALGQNSLDLETTRWFLLIFRLKASILNQMGSFVAAHKLYRMAVQRCSPPNSLLLRDFAMFLLKQVVSF